MKKSEYSTYALTTSTVCRTCNCEVSAKEGDIFSEGLYVRGWNKVADMLYQKDAGRDSAFSDCSAPQFPDSNGFSLSTWNFPKKFMNVLGMYRALEACSEGTLRGLQRECKRQFCVSMGDMGSVIRDASCALRARALKGVFLRKSRMPKVYVWKMVPCEFCMSAPVVFPKGLSEYRGYSKDWLHMFKAYVTRSGVREVRESASISPSEGIVIVPLYNKLFSVHGFLHVWHDDCTNVFESSNDCASAPFIGIRRVGDLKRKYEIFLHKDNKAVLLATTTDTERVLDIADREVAKAVMGAGHTMLTKTIRDVRVYKPTLVPATKAEAIARCDAAIEHFSRNFTSLKNFGDKYGYTLRFGYGSNAVELNAEDVLKFYQRLLGMKK